MNKLHESIESARASLATAELFLLKYESKLPEGLGGLTCGCYGTQFDVILTHRSQDDRNKALTYLGETFGRADWEANIGYDRDYFNWSKVVDGVRIKIEGAQPTGQPKSFPVDPKQFPLQIADVTQPAP